MGYRNGHHHAAIPQLGFGHADQLLYPRDMISHSRVFGTPPRVWPSASPLNFLLFSSAPVAFHGL